MSRKLHHLTAKAVEKQSRPGYHADGAGLYLQVSPGGSKSWLYRFMLDGRAREMGLGSLLGVSLADARTKAADCRKLLANNIDPIEARNAGRARLALTAAKSVMFTECAKAYVKAHSAGWTNARHAAQWGTTLEQYCYPAFGALPVQAVDTGIVLKALEPIWTEKPETAARVRARIEAVLDWATARGHRVGDNPARWRGHMDKLLPKLEKKNRVVHLAALSYGEVAQFMIALRAQEGVAARALEFLILTAGRAGEVLGARWSEIDVGVWIIPAVRMKARREHRVPLSPQAMAVLAAMAKIRQGDYIFPGQSGKKPMAGAAMRRLLKGMGREGITVHGFRSCFRDWTAESTAYPREVTEMALAHSIGDATEAAYRRGDLLEKRSRLMADWAKFCDMPKGAGIVLPMTRTQKSA